MTPSFRWTSFSSPFAAAAFHGETFPVFWPNLGPNVYAAFHGAELDYGEVTSWIRHCVHDWDDMQRLKFSRDNEYFRSIEELTRVALEKCAGQVHGRLHRFARQPRLRRGLARSAAALP